MLFFGGSHLFSLSIYISPAASTTGVVISTRAFPAASQGHIPFRRESLLAVNIGFS